MELSVPLDAAFFYEGNMLVLKPLFTDSLLLCRFCEIGTVGNIGNNHMQPQKPEDIVQPYHLPVYCPGYHGGGGVKPKGTFVDWGEGGRGHLLEK